MISSRSITTTTPSRRAVIRTAAWSVPVISVAATAPAFAASPPPAVIVTGPVVYKCPGQSAGSPSSYAFEFTFSSTPSSAQATSIVVNGNTLTVTKTLIEGTAVTFGTAPTTNSADAAGSGRITYTADGQTREYSFTYVGSRPNKAVCAKVSA